MTWGRHQQVPAPGLGVIRWQAWPARGSDGANAGGLRALRALGYLELHMLVLLKAAEAGAVNLGVVHEDVRSVGTGDEAVALLRVEPLDGSLCHVAPYRGWIRVRAVRYPGRFSTRLPQVPEAARPQRRPPELVAACSAGGPFCRTRRFRSFQAAGSPVRAPASRSWAPGKVRRPSRADANQSKRNRA